MIKPCLSELTIHFLLPVACLSRIHRHAVTSHKPLLDLHQLTKTRPNDSIYTHFSIYNNELYSPLRQQTQTDTYINTCKQSEQTNKHI